MHAVFRNSLSAREERALHERGLSDVSRRQFIVSHRWNFCQ